jgi:chromosome segregation ATPase
MTATADRIKAEKQAEAAQLTASLAELAQAEETAAARVAEMQARVDALKEKAELKDNEVKRLKTYQDRLDARIAELEDARAKADAARATAQEEAAQAARDLEAEQAKVVAAAELAATETARAEAASQRAQAIETGLSVLIAEIKGGTIGTDETGNIRIADMDSPLPAFPEIKPVMDAAVALSDEFQAVNQTAIATRAVLDEELAAVRDQLQAEWTAFNALRRTLGALRDRAKRWIMRDDMPADIADEGFALLTDADALWRGRAHSPEGPS